jgi:hypothetical protein
MRHFAMPTMKPQTTLLNTQPNLFLILFAESQSIASETTKHTADVNIIKNMDFRIILLVSSP